MNYRDALHSAFSRLPHHLAHQARQHRAWRIVQHATGKTHAQLISADYMLSEHETDRLNMILTEHIDAHKPLQYIEGSVPFGDLILDVTPPVLIPRPETEQWISHLITHIQQHALNTPLRILDLCTGSGCIALALAHALPQSHVTGVDINPDAIARATHNAHKNNITNVTFYISDLFANIPKHHTFDLIVSNPPYVTEEEWAHLEPSVTTWEDRNALVAPDNGLQFYTTIAQHAPPFLSSALNSHLPHLVFEIGATQYNDVQAILTIHKFMSKNRIHDESGHDRCIWSRHTSRAG